VFSSETLVDLEVKKAFNCQYGCLNTRYYNPTINVMGGFHTLSILISTTVPETIAYVQVASLLLILFSFSFLLAN
jgi:hypothetical protein